MRGCRGHPGIWSFEPPAPLTLTSSLELDGEGVNLSARPSIDSLWGLNLREQVGYTVRVWQGSLWGELGQHLGLKGTVVTHSAGPAPYSTLPFRGN